MVGKIIVLDVATNSYDAIHYKQHRALYGS